jgi:hypothetical protein
MGTSYDPSFVDPAAILKNHDRLPRAADAADCLCCLAHFLVSISSSKGLQLAPPPTRQNIVEPINGVDSSFVWDYG